LGLVNKVISLWWCSTTQHTIRQNHSVFPFVSWWWKMSHCHCSVQSTSRLGKIHGHRCCCSSG